MKIRNWLINGLALCAMGVPSVALEVYNNDDKKVEVYGNIRGYLMESNARSSSYTNNGTTSTSVNPVWTSGWNAGLQTNSRLGTKFTIGKFVGQIELGLQESGILGNANTNADDVGFRLFYGQYDFGAGGKIVFGKTNTPTLPTGYVNDIMSTDNGAWGFGALPISFRKFQLQYTIAGITIALIEDTVGSFNGIPANNTLNPTNLRRNYVPRIALAYEFKTDSLQAKVAGTFRYYQTWEAANKYGSVGTGAFHLMAAAKFNIDKIYVAGILHYGMNGDLYGEQRLAVYSGGYNHTPIATLASEGDAHMAGFHVESGIPLGDKLSVIVGLGYQVSAFTRLNNFVAHSYKMSVGLPYKLHKNVTITPQLGWYETIYNRTSDTNTNYVSNNFRGGFAGVIRAEFNF